VSSQNRLVYNIMARERKSPPERKNAPMVQPGYRNRALGASGLLVSPLGVGTNKWTEGANDESVSQTFVASVDAGINFFDTAEVYNSGRSERLLGACLQKDRRPVVIASKFAPWPSRLTYPQFAAALDASLRRLGIASLDLYYIHWPFTLLGVDTLMDWMSRAVASGKVRSVGVSNFTAAQMRRAANRLARHQIPLAANEVHYSLTHRDPETNGVLAACRDLNVALVAYRPLEGGRISTPSSEVSGPQASSKLTQALRSVAEQHSGASTTQVALSWLLRRDELVIPIPGATGSKHAQENAAALELQLSDQEFSSIDQASSSTT
jgi:aryl-alcohol dehydrogenase-like predicted oxidoreductase